MGPIKLTMVTSGGTGELVLTQQWDIATWVRVIPPAENVVYDLELEDADGHLMVLRTGITGTYSEKLQISLATLNTVSIANATQDGTFTIKFDLRTGK